MKINISENGKLPVSAGRIGLFLEDINYALDGGLYAEMLENRDFEAKRASGSPDHFTVADDGYYGWSAYPAGVETALKIKTDRPLFAENAHYLRLTARRGGEGVRNKAYDGVYLQKDMRYNLSFYLRSYDYKGSAEVGVYAEGAPLIVKKLRIRADGKWRKFSFRLKAKADADRADFAFVMGGAGTVHLDCFSLIPENAIKGVFRRDLVEWMKELKPGFLRFPGGCVVEGNTFANRYRWKDTLGPVEYRRHNWNRWAVHAADEQNGFVTPYAHYGQTLGIGFYEFFLLCEYLGAKALPVVGVGIACEYMSTECVPIGSEEWESCVQDALDLIEFANGGTDTEWGSVRAEMGHPEPFGLEYLGIGNEQWERGDNAFYRRYELFEQRIHEVYPAIRLIGTAGPTVETETYLDAWKWIRARAEENPDFVYAVDEHFYMPPEWLYAHTQMYDAYPRGCKVYAGEYAAHVPGAGCALFNAPEANVWEGTLAEAAFMTGMERNADVVVMASYAPLFARLGYTQWSPDLIWFDGSRSYATASYHVQRLYSLYTGNYVLRTAVEGEEKVYASASEREGLVYVKVVNAGDRALEAEVDGDYDFGSLTRIICMEAPLSAYNTMEDPHAVEPVEVAPSSERTLTIPPHSFQVLVFRK